ncbi:MAG TPA: hypothetical protein VHU24_03175 [Solirubrobacterales bacterium]|jgi:hypothetical protein|nr:hypothetical protein [Solirubrobacterales bacterium]
MNQIFDVAGLIVILAIIATLVTSKQTAPVIKAVGGTFTESIKAAKGS